MRKARMTAIPLAAIALVATLPLSASAEGAWSQKGSDIPGAAIGDGFGIALDIDGDGDTVAIGADSNNDGGSDSGHVQVLGYSAGAWSRIGSILVGDDADDFFGSAVSLSDDGTRVAIGAPFDDDGGGSSGHVQVWENVGGTWSQMGATLVGEDAGERAGSSVAISGDGTTVVIGSPFNDDGGTDRGEVRVYTWNSGTSTWDRTGTADLQGEADQDRLGYSVAINTDGTIIAAGARDNDGTGSAAGHARVYTWNTGTSQWDQRGSDIDGEATGDRFGTAVSLSADGDALAVGAPKNNIGGTATDAGHVQVYDWNSGTSAWVQRGSDVDGAAGDLLGTSVSLSSSGSRLAVGAPGGDTGGVDAGFARLYEWDGVSWTSLGVDHGGSAGDEAGTAVSLSGAGSDVAMGLPFNDDVAANAGLVQVFTYTLSVSEVAQVAGTPGIYLHVAGPVGRSAQGSPVYYGSDRVAITSTYLLSLTSTTGRTQRILATGVVDARGNLEAMAPLPALMAGTYDVVFTGRHHGGVGLSLSARITIGVDGRIVSLQDNVAVMD